MQVADYNLLYNSLSFAIATFGASTVFFFCQRSQVAPAYKTSLTLAGLVCLIALYHYLRIFESFNEAYIVIQDGLVNRNWRAIECKLSLCWMASNRTHCYCLSSSWSSGLQEKKHFLWGHKVDYCSNYYGALRLLWRRFSRYQSNTRKMDILVTGNAPFLMYILYN